MYFLLACSWHFIYPVFSGLLFNLTGEQGQCPPMTGPQESQVAGEHARLRAARQKAVARAVCAVNTEKGEGHTLPGGLQHHLVLGFSQGQRCPCPCGLRGRGCELLLSLKRLLPHTVLRNMQVNHEWHYGPLGTVGWKAICVPRTIFLRPPQCSGCRISGVRGLLRFVWLSHTVTSDAFYGFQFAVPFLISNILGQTWSDRHKKALLNR